MSWRKYVFSLVSLPRRTYNIIFVDGIDELIEGLKFQCQQHNVPYCFSLVRREFAYALQKRAQIACVAVLDYDGANAVFVDVLHELEDARKEYKRLTAL